MSCLSTNDLHRIFERLDRNGEGKVSLDELQWLLESIDAHSSHNELRSLIGKPSLDLIDFICFYDTLIKHQNYYDDDDESSNNSNNSNLLNAVENNVLAEAFRVFDMNGDGFITSEELQSVLTRLGMWNEQCGRECKTMIKAYDANSDGVLDFEEFKKMMLITNSL